jgi:hypothetical protein
MMMMLLLLEVIEGFGEGINGNDEAIKNDEDMLPLKKAQRVRGNYFV